MGFLGSEHIAVSHTRHSIRSLAALFLLSTLLHLDARAADGFKMFTQPLLISSERGEVTSYVVMTGTKPYSFLPPPRWNISVSAAEKTVTFLSEDFTASIVIRFIPGITKTSEDLRSDSARAEVAARYADSKIEQDFICHTSGAEGVAFDLERRAEGRPSVSIRLATVLFDDSIVEFTLTTETKRFAKFHWTLGNLLTSFRIDPGLRLR